MMSATTPNRFGPRAWVLLGLAAVLLGFAVACPFAARLGPAVQWGSGLVGAALALAAVLPRR